MAFEPSAGRTWFDNALCNEPFRRMHVPRSTTREDRCQSSSHNPQTPCIAFPQPSDPEEFPDVSSDPSPPAGITLRDPGQPEAVPQPRSDCSRAVVHLPSPNAGDSTFETTARAPPGGIGFSRWGRAKLDVPSGPQRHGAESVLRRSDSNLPEVAREPSFRPRGRRTETA